MLPEETIVGGLREQFPPLEEDGQRLVGALQRLPLRQQRAQQRTHYRAPDRAQTEHLILQRICFLETKLFSCTVREIRSVPL